MQTVAEYLPDGSPWVSFVHGPIVLSAVTDTTGLVGLRADDSRMGHIANGPLYPIDEAPLMVTSQKNIASQITNVKGKPLTFHASGLIYPSRYKDLELLPFFQVHDARYMIYWHVTDSKGLGKLQQTLRDNEKAKLVLESVTLDQVAPGEQQPESDHNFQGENTESGVYMDRHWRTAGGWFSYQLKNKNKEADKLRVTYFGGDRNRNFDILINDIHITSVKLDGVDGEKFVEKDYPLPGQLATEDVLTIKFIAHPGSTAGGIYYLRLIKK